MAGKFLRGIVIGVGTGLAFGIGSTMGRARKTRTRKTKMFDGEDILQLEPLLDRLDSLESRVSAHQDSIPTSMQVRLGEQASQISELRTCMSESEARADEARALTEQRFAEVRAELPEVVSAAVHIRFDELRLRLYEEFEQRQQQTLSEFETALELKISERIGAIGGKLSQQSILLDSITRRSVENDQNLQRLIGAVEKLVETTDSPIAITTENQEQKNQNPDLVNLHSINKDLPFEAHLRQAMAEGPLHFPSNIQVGGLTEVERVNKAEEVRRRRTPMAPLMMIAFTIGSLLFR